MFSGYSQTGLLSKDQVLITEWGLSIFYSKQGGSQSSDEEYHEYLKVIEGAEGVYTRIFISNEGTRLKPNPVRTVHIITPDNNLGKMICDALRESRIMPPQIILSTSSDLNFDPTSLMPMVVRDKFGKWRRHDRNTINNWPQEIVGH
jgi:hypothetical protein